MEILAIFLCVGGGCGGAVRVRGGEVHVRGRGVKALSWTETEA